MNREMIIENNLVDRYLLGQLDESEAMAFEDFYASSPETLAELENAARMIDGLAHTARGSDTVGAKVTSLSAARERKSTLTRVLTSPLYSAAATLVAVAALVIVGINSQVGGLQDSSPMLASNTAVGNVPFAVLSATRGSDTGMQVSLNDSSEFLMGLDVGYTSETSFVASLQSANGDLLLRKENLVPNAEQALTLLIPSAMTPDGNYRVIVRSMGEDGSTLTFPFSTTTH